MKFLCREFQKLEHKQDKYTDRRDRKHYQSHARVVISSFQLFSDVCWNLIRHWCHQTTRSTPTNQRVKKVHLPNLLHHCGNALLVDEADRRPARRLLALTNHTAVPIKTVCNTHITVFYWTLQRTGRQRNWSSLAVTCSFILSSKTRRILLQRSAPIAMV